MERPEAHALSIEAKLELLLAQGASHDRVLELLVDILIERGREMAEQKRERCGHLIRSLVAHCETATLAVAARRLASLDYIPRSLLLSLARQSIEVAQPVLSQALDLPTDELVAVVAKAGPDHLKAIAARAGLDETLTTSLIARGNREATATCARNRKAKLSRTSFEDLVAMADEDKSIRQALCHRHDLPDAVLPRFWPGCDDGEKARLLVAGFSDDESHAASQAAAEADSHPAGESASDKPAEEEAIKLDRQLAEIILQYSDIGSLTRTSQMLAERAGIDEGIAFDLVCGSYERGLVVLARAANVDEWTFLQLICARMKLTSAKTAPHRALKAFREYPRDEARKVLLEIISIKSTETFQAKQAKAGAKKRSAA
jgi:uncharacterized protein (DUF2336 family)